jgi:hypothetical protein
VLSEIDEIAKATFRSITLATMLQLIERQQASATAPTARQRPDPGAPHPTPAHSSRHKARGRRRPA